MKRLILALLLLVPTTASANWWVTYAGNGARMPIRLNQNVDWASGDTKIVSEEVVGVYSAHSDFTVTEVTTTGVELNGVQGSSVGGMTTGLVALAGGGQTGATALSTGANNVITSATAGDSVKLPTAATGNVVWVKNSGATAIDIFPFLADSIDALAVNLAVTLHPGGSAQFHAISTTVWESNIDNSISLNGPTTAKGGVRILAADNTGDTDVTITNAAHGQATVVTVPDAGLATSYVVQSTAAITAAEANVLDGATAGTAVASKAVVVDANIDVGTLRNVTATGTVQAEQLTSTDDITATDNIAGASFINTDNVGSVNTGVTAVEYGDGYAHHTVLTVSQVDAVTVTDNSAICDGYLLYTFPAGEIIIENVSVSMATTLAEDSANAAAEACVGNVIGSDTQATCGADDAGLENFLGPITTADMSGTPDVLTVATGSGTPVVIATAAAHLLHWNICSTWNDTAGVDLTGDIAGTVVVDWKFMQ
jgi:hypothetical protein